MNFFGGFNLPGAGPMSSFDSAGMNNNFNQYLESLRAQLMQQYMPPQNQNPYAQVDARIEQYMTQNGYPPRQQQPAALPAPQEQPQNPMQLVTAAISESVSAADMELIAANIARVPDWIRSNEGKKFVQQATGSIKKFVGGKNSGADPVAPESGATT
jgi:hypothetical protein